MSLDDGALLRGDRLLLHVDPEEKDFRAGMELRRRNVSEEQMRKFEGYVAEILTAFGLDLNAPATEELVRLFAKRFSVQERIGQQIADALEAMLQPHGVAVYMEAHHLCTQMRGVQAVSPWRGLYDDDPALRSEFLVACGSHR